LGKLNQIHTKSAPFDFNAITLTEIWHNFLAFDNEIFGHKFSTYLTDRPSFAGGDLIAVKNKFSSELFPIANDVGTEFVAVKVSV